MGLLDLKPMYDCFRKTFRVKEVGWISIYVSENGRDGVLEPRFLYHIRITRECVWALYCNRQSLLLSLWLDDCVVLHDT